MPTPVVKRRTKLVVGSTHTLLTPPITVFTVVELRRVPNKRGTTSTIPVWRGACRKCGDEWDQPRIVAPGFRTCLRCRGYIQGQAEISADVAASVVIHAERVKRWERETGNLLAANAHRGVDIVHEPVSTSHTKPVFTDR